jgi:hypothetical protein
LALRASVHARRLDAVCAYRALPSHVLPRLFHTLRVAICTLGKSKHNNKHNNKKYEKPFHFNLHNAAPNWFGKSPEMDSNHRFLIAQAFLRNNFRGKRIGGITF